MFKDILKLKELVVKAAKEELLEKFTRVTGYKKADGSIVTEVDLAMQKRLYQELQENWPGIAMLSEEMSVEEQKNVLKNGGPFWCLDPLDGTSNYAAGIPYFAVSLSLIDSDEVVVGLVYDPIRDECFSAEKNSDPLLNDNALKLNLQVKDISESIAIIDFKRLPEELSVRLIKEQPFASQRNFGASALDWCWMAANRGHLYLHGKQNIWDYSAGLFIFQKAGGCACSFEGEDIFINQLIGRSVIAAENDVLLKKWKNWVGNNK